MAVEAKILMSDTIEGVEICSMNNQISFAMSTASTGGYPPIETKDYYIVPSNNNCNYFVFKKENDSPKFLKMMYFPQTIDIGGVTYNLQGRGNTSYGPNRYTNSVSPIGSENQVVAFYANSADLRAIACYNITDTDFVLQSSQVYYTSTDTGIETTDYTPIYSIYGDYIIVVTSYCTEGTHYDFSSNYRYKWRYGYGSYIGKVTTTGLTLNTLTYPQFVYTTDSSIGSSSSYAIQHYCNLIALIYNKNYAYIGILFYIPSGSETKYNPEFSAYLKKVTLSSGYVKACSVSDTNSFTNIERGCTGSNCGPDTLRTENYVFQSNWYIDTQGKVYRNSSGLRVGDTAMQTSLPKKEVFIKTGSINQFYSIVENEDLTLTNKKFTPSEAKTMTILGDKALVSETLYSGYCSYLHPYKIDEKGTVYYNTPNNQKCVYICPPNKITQVTSLHMINNLKEIDQVVLLYADGKLITRFIVNGDKIITYANCPLIFNPNTVLEFRAIQPLESIHITMFGIEEDV